ncbi:MAG: DoxX family membrane protein [Actinomycetota bacterium]|nr:DoxX family membrane protein [Actinomycetota bacterium]
MRSVHQRFLQLENRIHHQLVLHSITALRIAVGAIFLGFGVLKYFPGVSPAQNITEASTHILFLGLIPGDVAIRMIATLECFIGICLLANRWMRLAVWMLAIEFVGILSPLFLLPGRLFAGPDHAPNLLGQYVLKDIILVTAALVIVAATFRGGRLVRSDPAPGDRSQDETEPDPEPKELPVVLDGVSDERLITALCERHHISESEFHEWRETSRGDASSAVALETATVGNALARAPRIVARPAARGCVRGDLAEAASRRTRLEHTRASQARASNAGAGPRRQLPSLDSG